MSKIMCVMVQWFHIYNIPVSFFLCTTIMMMFHAVVHFIHSLNFNNVRIFLKYVRTRTHVMPGVYKAKLFMETSSCMCVPFFSFFQIWEENYIFRFITPHYLAFLYTRYSCIRHTHTLTHNKINVQFLPFLVIRTLFLDASLSFWV